MTSPETLSFITTDTVKYNPLLIPCLTDDVKLCEDIPIANLLVNTAMHSFLTGCWRWTKQRGYHTNA